jgi:uncharacterized protein
MEGDETKIVAVAEGEVSGFLHRPARADGRGLVLTHGAGGNCRAPLLNAAATAFAAAGVTTLRCDLAFRRMRPSGPPHRATAAADRATLGTAVGYLRRLVAGPVYLGGHSYGGRQASMLVAEAPAIAAGLLLLSYPLHPPAKPDQMRTAHFPDLERPTIFVHGDADPFGAISELQQAIAAIPAPTWLIPIAGAGHDLRRGRIDFVPIVASLTAV